MYTWYKTEELIIFVCMYRSAVFIFTFTLLVMYPSTLLTSLYSLLLEESVQLTAITIVRDFSKVRKWMAYLARKKAGPYVFIPGIASILSRSLINMTPLSPNKTLTKLTLLKIIALYYQDLYKFCLYMHLHTRLLNRNH